MTLTITVTASAGGQVATASVTVDVEGLQPGARFTWFGPARNKEG